MKSIWPTIGNYWENRQTTSFTKRLRHKWLFRVEIFIKFKSFTHPNNGGMLVNYSLLKSVTTKWTFIPVFISTLQIRLCWNFYSIVQKQQPKQNTELSTEHLKSCTAWMWNKMTFHKITHINAITMRLKRHYFEFRVWMGWTKNNGNFLLRFQHFFKLQKLMVRQHRLDVEFLLLDISH